LFPLLSGGPSVRDVRIAVIGTDRFGTAFAHRPATAGHEVRSGADAEHRATVSAASPRDVAPGLLERA
jgi:predicted dinucleotide-binding enzyme